MNKNAFKVFPEFETDRLFVRAFTEAGGKPVTLYEKML